ncbi:DUF4265 domain-containing protein [Micromonospora vinacea]|uniref:DUF4265 domain-containing protein n=1 Tax=Micromonospora vinacea TaxID=709878 RepID=UPI003557D86A
MLIGTTRAGQDSFESLLATPVGPDLYVLERSPLMADGMARGDTVRIENGGRTYRVVRDGDHYALQIYYRRDLELEDLRDMESRLAEVGGEIDAHAARVIAVTSPRHRPRRWPLSLTVIRDAGTSNGGSRSLHPPPSCPDVRGGPQPMVLAGGGRETRIAGCRRGC